MLRRKLRRDLMGSWLLLAAIALMIAVGITTLVSLQSAYRNLQSAQQRYYQQCRLADFWIDARRVPRAELDALSRLGGLEVLEGRIRFMATVDLPRADRPVSCLVLSLPDRREPVLNDIVLRSGSYFSGDGPEEVIVNDAFAAAHSLAPGDRLRIRLNGRQRDLLIVGTAISAEFTYLVGPGALLPDPSNFGVLYVPRTLAEDAFQFTGAVNQVAGRFAPGATAEQRIELLDRIERELEEFGVATVTKLSEQTSNQFLTNEIRGLGATATVVPAGFLVVAALVLNVFVNRLARQQRLTIGTLKALGISDRQLFMHFLQFGLAVGIAGSLLGSVLGYASSVGMTEIYRDYFEFPDLRSDYYVRIHAIGIFASLVCATLGSLQGARTVLRLHPAEAMRPEPPVRGGAVFLERASLVWRRLSASWRLALRSLMRNRRRSLTSLFASAMGAALLCTGFMMVETQYFLIDFQFKQWMRSDVDLQLEDERGEEAVRSVARLPNVLRAEPQFHAAGTLVHGRFRKRAAVTGLSADARLTVPRDRQGRAIRIPQHGIVLTQRLADILHVSPGDRVQLLPVRGERDPVHLTVASVADSYLGLGAYADRGYLSRVLHGENVVNAVQLKIEPGQESAVLRRLKEFPAVESVIPRREIIVQMEETLLKNQWVMITIMVSFAGVVFFGSIFNSSMINLAERRREVATMRALGFGSWHVGFQFLRESLVLNMAGTLLGLPMGYVLMHLATWSYRENDLIRIPVVTAPWTSFATLGCSLAFALLAHLAVQRFITRMNCVEALQARE